MYDLSFITFYNVTSLYLYKTGIKILTPLTKCTAVEILYINDCKIEDTNQIVCLSGMKNLKILACCGNPMCDKDDFLQKLAFAVPASISKVYEMWYD